MMSGYPIHYEVKIELPCQEGIVGNPVATLYNGPDVRQALKVYFDSDPKSSPKLYSVERIQLSPEEFM